MNECFPGLLVIGSSQGLNVPYLIFPRTLQSINLMKGKALLSGLTKVPHLGKKAGTPVFLYKFYFFCYFVAIKII